LFCFSLFLALFLAWPLFGFPIRSLPASLRQAGYRSRSRQRQTRHRQRLD